MVTGSNQKIETRCEYIDSGLESLKASEGQLSIFLAGDGLSFSLIHRATGKVLLLNEYLLPNSPGSALEMLHQFNESFDSYMVGWQAEKHTWIPSDLFDESQLPTLVQDTLGITDYQFTEVPELNAVIVHSPLPESLERIVEALPEAKVLPHSAIHALALTKHWKTLPGDQLYCNIEEDVLSLTAISNGKLVLQNSFPADCNENRLYYLLFAFEQLKYHPDQVAIKLSGQVDENDAFWSQLEKYVRRIDLLENLDNIHPSSSIPQVELRKHAPLIQLHSCG